MMKPAPITTRKFAPDRIVYVPDPHGEPICALDCGETVYDAEYGWNMRDVESDGYPVPVNYCPYCGRAVDEDEDGNPVVGPSCTELDAELAHYKRAADKMTREIAKHRYGHKDWYMQDDNWQKVQGIILEETLAGTTLDLTKEETDGRET